MITELKKKQLIGTIVLYLFGILSVALINPYIKIHFYRGSSLIVIIFFYLLLFFFVMKYFSGDKKTITWNTKRDIVRNIFVLIILFLIVALKVIFLFISNLKGYPKYSKTMDLMLLQLCGMMIGGPAEELFYKRGMLSLFENIRIPKVVVYIIISFIFAISHWTLSFGFIFTFFVQFFSLILFNLFPSILAFSIVHIISNIIAELMMYKIV